MDRRAGAGQDLARGTGAVLGRQRRPSDSGSSTISSAKSTSWSEPSCDLEEQVRNSGGRGRETSGFGEGLAGRRVMVAQESLGPDRSVARLRCKPVRTPETSGRGRQAVRALMTSALFRGRSGPLLARPSRLKRREAWKCSITGSVVRSGSASKIRQYDWGSHIVRRGCRRITASQAKSRFAWSPNSPWTSHLATHSRRSTRAMGGVDEDGPGREFPAEMLVDREISAASSEKLRRLVENASVSTQRIGTPTRSSAAWM